MLERRRCDVICQRRAARGWKCCVATGLLILAAGMPARSNGAEPRVQIDSSYDHSSNSYAWEVRNLDESPIVAIEFPHYGADLFTVPDGWKTSTPEDMNLVRVGWDDSIGGILRADRGDDPLGIWRGRSARFGARAPVHRTTPGEGTVRVVFQDGSEALVPGVTVPTMVERGSPWLGLLGGGALFLAWVIVREIRRRKAGAGQATGELAEPARRPDAAAP